MKRRILGVAALALAAGAHAQTSPSGLRGFVGVGLTGGGETLVELEYEDGPTQKIRSGGLAEFKAGGEYRFSNAPFSLQASVGYHSDRSSASNGSVRFTRYPLELLGYWHATPQFRLGAGLRKATNAKLRSSGVVAGVGQFDFNTNVGAVIEGEYLFNPRFGVTLRGVTEKYKFSDNSGSVSGNHFGMRANFYFF